MPSILHLNGNLTANVEPVLRLTKSLFRLSLLLVLMAGFLTSAFGQNRIKKPEKVEVLPKNPAPTWKPQTIPKKQSSYQPKKATAKRLPAGSTVEYVKLAGRTGQRQDRPMPMVRPARRTAQTLSICDNIELTRQSQIDSFPILFPGCTVVKKLTINGQDADPAITNLDSLQYITEVTGDLFIRNTAIVDLYGLRNNTKVGSYLWIENNNQLVDIEDMVLTQLGGVVLSNLPALVSMNSLFSNLTNTELWSCLFDNLQLDNAAFGAFSPVTKVFNFSVASCPNITALNGFENLTAAPFGINLANNENLSDISVLDQITETNYLSIYFNNQLSSLQGLHNLQLISGTVNIVGNENLTSLADFNDALQVLNEVDTDRKTEILYNSNLSVCNEPWLCQYLSTSLAVSIEGNAPGCTNVTEVISNCPVIPGCATPDTLTWLGNDSEDWNNPANWSPSGIPGTCTRVIIPAGTNYTARLLDHVSIGGLIMNGSTIEGEGFNLFVKEVLKLENAFVSGVPLLSAEAVASPSVLNSTIYNSLSCTGYYGKAEFLSNYIGGDLLLSDSSIRDDGSTAFFNTIGRNLTLINNSHYGQNYLSNASPFHDEIVGNLHVINNSDADISVALGGGQPLRVGGDARFDNTASGNIDINNFTFNNPLTESRLYSSGPRPLIINRLFIDKGNTNKLVLETNLTIAINLNMTGFGTHLVSALPNKLLSLLDDVTVNLNGNQNFVEGPLRKLGNDAFIFPLGAANGSSFKTAPLQITEPADFSDAFTAQYLPRNPSPDGFDTSSTPLGFGFISGKEYWILQRDAGASQVAATLYYDSSRSGIFYDRSRVQLAGWNGSSWLPLGNGGTTGSLRDGTIRSAGALSNYGPITFSAIPVRKPVITIGQLDSPLCAGSTFKVPVLLDTAMVQGNQFTVQLSDASGSFAGFVPQIGTKISSTSDTIIATVPNVFPVGANYRIRVVGNLPADTSVNTINVFFRRIPQQTFTISGPLEKCLNSDTTKYFPSAVEAGVQYLWTLSSGGSLTQRGDTALVVWQSVGTFNLSVRSANGCGNGPLANASVLIKTPAPVTAPMLGKAGRWLNASIAPNVTWAWERNGNAIAGVSENRYYASQGGSYRVSFANNCGAGPKSDPVVFAAASLPQNISFNQPANRVFGDVPFTFDGSSSAGLPISYSLLSGPGNLTAGVFTVTQTGTVQVLASQPGDDVYDTAVPVLRSFTISKAAQSISLPAADDPLFPAPPIQLSAIASSGLAVNYALVSGNATLNNRILSFNGLGQVIVSASQPGDINYLPAATVYDTLCVRVNALTSISGNPFVCPGQTVTYSINQVGGLTYHWRLSNGTSFASTGSSATISWPTPGTYTLLVSATGPCGASTATDTLMVQVQDAITPGTVGNMLPANGASGQQLPLNLSWLPSANTLSYDLFVWDSGTTKPSQPLAANLTSIVYNLGANSLAFNKAYQWQIVSKNGCLSTTGPIQWFRLRPAADLLVAAVTAPSSANSGQTISIGWTIKNVGPGNTTTSEKWTDAVFLSFDTMPRFDLQPDIVAGVWSQLSFPVRTLLVGTKPNVSALDSGQQYSNSIDFTLPLNYNLPIYAYVITNYPAGLQAPQQVSLANDTARTPQTIQVILSPTPDLRVDSVVTTSAAFSGSNITVSYKVKNYGANTPPSSNWTDKVYLSPSALFNPNNAILLNQPKPNGNYYPNPLPAAFSQAALLVQDSGYNKQVQVVIPNFIQGTWFIHVQTNSTGSLYEGLASSNNTQQTALQVFLTPTPVFRINQLSVPSGNLSTTQPFTLSWNILNEGFNDNAERNRGHYFVPSTCISSGNTIATLRDSLGFGGSSWKDEVYLSQQPNGLQEAQAIKMGTVTHGLPGFGLLNSPEGVVGVSCGTTNQGNINTTNVLRPGSNHPQSLNLTIPANLAAGNWYVYVKANADRGIYLFPDTPVIRRNALPLVVQRPDLTVAALSLPTNTVGGTSFTINYTVRNTGAGSIFGRTRRDDLYVSQQPTFNGSATIVQTLMWPTNLAAGDSANHSTTYQFAPGTSGTRYFYLVTNIDTLNGFSETRYDNNTSTAGSTVVSTATPSDLIVSAASANDSIFSYALNTLRYTITNQGAAASGERIDSLFISCVPTFSHATVVNLGVIKRPAVQPAGGSVLDSISFNPFHTFEFRSPCTTPANGGLVYLFVKTAAGEGIFEASLTDNNLSAPVPVRLVNSLVDHELTLVEATDNMLVGRSYPVRWTVTNRGVQTLINPQRGNDYYFWRDVVLFSPDSVLNSNSTEAFQIVSYSRLANGASYTERLSTTVPNLPTGDYYLHVVTNYLNEIRSEVNLTNNSNLLRGNDGRAKTVRVVRPDLPDLTDSLVEVPAIAPTGQPMTIVHRVANNGIGVTFPTTWSNSILLSTDAKPDRNDIVLSARNRSATLAAGTFYNDTVTALIPANTLPGNYLLLAVADAGNAVVELNDSNNVALGTITVFVPSPSDLRVIAATHPDTVLLGYPLPATWTLTNEGVHTATGSSTDGLYLSQSGNIDATALLLGVQQKSMALAPLEQQTVSLEPLVIGAREGSYNVLVRADVLNNLPETNKANNTYTSPRQLYVGVMPLPLGTELSTTLPQTNRYYKLNLPASLLGATLLITLETNDSATRRNEMFVGGSYVPDPSRFDFRFERPNAGNQQIVIPSAADTAYYILIRSVDGGQAQQQIRLRAVQLPFALLQVQTNSGGNGGNVTVRLSGSLFTPDMTVQLKRGATTISAFRVQFTNSIQAFATFPLQGKPLGIYDVVLRKPDGSEAILPSGFSIVAPNNGGVITGGGVNTGPNKPSTEPGCDPGADAGLNSLLITELIQPDKVLSDWDFVVQINYSNPTNMDIPIPVRTLFNDKNVAMALRREDLEQGTSLLTIPLSEPGGPAGFIRAGGRGSIIVHVRAPRALPGHTIITFTLK